MATLPWTTTEVAPDPGTEAVVLGSRLELRSLRDVPVFLGAALKLRKLVREMPGALGVSLIAQPSRKTFWTLSAWGGEADARRASSAHRRTSPSCSGSTIDSRAPRSPAGR